MLDLLNYSLLFATTCRNLQPGTVHVLANKKKSKEQGQRLYAHCCTHTVYVICEVRTESCIVEIVLTFAQQFSRPGRSLKKFVKSLECFFYFSKLKQVLHKRYFFSFWSNLTQCRPYVAVDQEKSLLSSFVFYGLY